MRITFGLSVLVLVAPAIGANDPALEARLRQLEKEIAAVRELPFKAPVTARVISRTKDTDPKLQGYYSPKEKTLFLFNDLKDSYGKGVLIHEMVHALQDQHFDLVKLKARLHETPGTDAEMALAALIEGDAQYTMIEVLKKEQPKVSAMLDVPLSKSKNLDSAFLYAQGARYVKAIKERGGWSVVNFSYKMPPRNTASIIHLKTVSTLDLGPGKTTGELGLIKLLASEPATREQAFTAPVGWRGDRVLPGDLSKGKAWVIAMNTTESASTLQKTLADLFRAKNPGSKPLPGAKDPALITGRTPSGNTWGVALRGTRLHVIQAPDIKTHVQLRDRLDNPLPMQVWPLGVKDKPHDWTAAVKRWSEADFVCVGESHNAELHHQAQLEIIKALHAQDKRVGVGLEMFQRPFQEHIDRYIAGETKEDEFLKKSEYAARWGYDWSLYKPIVDFCRANKIPVAALNAPKELTSKISKTGHASLSADEKKQLGTIDFDHAKHRAHWYETLPKLHGQDKATPEQKERSYQVMAVWDDYMAASAARFHKERNLKRMVILAGSGHIEHGFGIPDRAAKHGGGRAVTINLRHADGQATGEGITTQYLVVVE